jgi:putative ABC transport system permease protein
VGGVAIGIAVVVAIRLANESSVRGFETALEAVSGHVSLEVTSPGVGVTEDRLAELSWLRTFGRVSPIIDRDVLIRSSTADERGELLRVLGVDILRDRPFREYRLVEGAVGRTPRAGPITTQEFLSLLTDPVAIVLTKVFAERHGFTVGSNVRLFVGDREVPLVVRALLGNDGPAQVLDGNFALMDIAAAQLAFGRLGVVDRVDIQLDARQIIDQAEREIAGRLPPGLSVQRPERRGAQVETMLAAFHFNLTALSYIALLVGLFLVYNAVTVSVISRRAEIGILRTVGTARSTILWLFLGEALSLSLVGCLVGAPLGGLLARAAVRMTASTVSTFWVAAAATVPEVGVGEVVLSFAIGVPLALAAAFLPAYEAARLTPLAAVRGGPDSFVHDRLPRRYVVSALVLFGLAGFFARQPPVSGLPVYGLAAALAVVGGAVLLVPVALLVLQRIRFPMSWHVGVEVMLARANLGAAIRRLSVSVSALVVSLAMMVAIAIMIGSFRETVVYWVEQTLQADLFISGARRSFVGDRGEISVDVERAVADYPGVAAVDGFRSVTVPYADSTIIVGSGRFDVLLAHGNLLFKSPPNGRTAMMAAVGEPAVVVSESFSLRYDTRVGDRIELPTPSGPKRFDVVAVYFDYSSDRGLVVMDEAIFARYYDERRPSGLTVYLDEGIDSQVAREGILASLGPTGLVFINTNAVLRHQVIEVFDSTFAITYALEGIAIFVSMFGVASTLLTLALERRRDMAMLRLVGAERHHLRRMIMVEAGLLGLVSLGIGVVVGLVLSLILIFVINVQSFGWTIQFHLPVMFLVQSSLAIIAATVLAGLYPARLAGRLTMADLREE